MLLMKQPNHLPFGNNKDPARGHRRRPRQANRLAGERPLTEEVARAQYPHDRLLPSLGQHRQLDPPLLNVENGVGGSTLRENDRRWCVGRRTSGHPGRIEEGLGVKYTPCLQCHRYPVRISDTPGRSESTRRVSERWATVMDRKDLVACASGRTGRRVRSVVQYDTQQRAVDLQREITGVLDEAKLLELVQKEIHASSRRANHLGERFL